MRRHGGSLTSGAEAARPLLCACCGGGLHQDTPAHAQACSGVTGLLAWVGWQSYASEIAANDSVLAGTREPDASRSVESAALVRSRGADLPLPERLAALRDLDNDSLRARFASLRLAPRSAEYEAEKQEVQRILRNRGATS